MTKDQALKEARRRFGKDAMVRDEGWQHASTAAERDAARAELVLLSERIAILKARQEELRGAAHKFQYTIGKVIGAVGFRGFHVTAQGDSWEACFAELDRKAGIIKNELEQPK